MFKKLPTYILILSLIMIINSSLSIRAVTAEKHSFNLTADEKAEELDLLYNFINDNCPYLPVMDEVRSSWYSRRAEFEKLVRETADDLEYYQALNRILGVLGNGHTNVVSPDYYSHLVELPLSGPWRQVLQKKEVREAYRYWEDVLEKNNQGLSFLARYIAGDYWVLYSAFPGLPEGARITFVDGQDVDRFVLENGSGLYLDPVRGKRYARFLPVPDRELQIGFTLENKLTELAVSGRVEKDKQVSLIKPPAQENISSAVLEKGRVAYLKVASFSYQNIARDRARIRTFFEKTGDYPYMIIDIRGNGGGDDNYWQDLLVSPLIDRPLLASFYIFYRSGDYVQPFLESTVGPGKAFMRVGRNTLLKRMNLPEEFLSSEYMDPLKLPYIIRPEDPVGFQGKVILLVDDLVYSAAESFAAFAKATDWATIVGTKTGGDGIGFTPIQLSLPNSKLLVRVPMTIGLNPEGSINTEGQTTPDIFLDYNPGDYLKIWNGEMNPGEDQMVEQILSMLDGEESRPEQISIGGLLSGFFRDYDGGYGYPVEDDLEQFNGMFIDSVKISGGFKTDKRLVRRVIGLRAGDRFSAAAVKLAGERLEAFNAHTSISLDVRSRAEDRVDINVLIQEGVGFALSPVSLSYNLIEDIINNRISYTHYNLGRKMVNIKGVFGTGPAEERYLTVTGPLFPGVPSKMTLSLGTYNDLEQVKWGEERGSSYKFQNIFLGFSDLIIPVPGLELNLGINYSRERVEKLQSETGLMLEDGEYLNSSVSLKKGWYRLAGGLLIDLAESGGLFPYAAFSADREIGLAEKTSLYLRGDIGWKEGATPFNHLFFPGGEGSFAAYSQGSLVGDRYLAAGLELRRYLNKNFYLALLTDGGKVWQPGEDLLFNPLLSGIGIKASYRTPVGLVLKGLYAFDPGQTGQKRIVFGLDTEF